MNTSPAQATVVADERVQIRWVLEQCKTVAVVGLSSNPHKDSHIVAHHLHRHGYELIPINPTATVILGQPVYPSLSALPEPVAGRVQLVVIFRPSEEVPQIVDAALALPHLLAIWTQKGIGHDAAVSRARAAGWIAIVDRCIRTQHLFTKFGQSA